jgi:hypothetical protein
MREALKALEDARVHAIFLRGRRKSADWVIRNLRAANSKIVRVLSTSTRPVHIEVLAGGIRILNAAASAADLEDDGP